MIIDALSELRAGGTADSITATEAGSTSTTRDATTGKVVVEIDKMPATGLPIEVIVAADAGTSNDKTIVITIQASDSSSFGSYDLICTFPTLTHGFSAVEMRMLTGTQRKYIRSVITVAGSNGTISSSIQIYVAPAGVDKMS